MMTHNTIKSTLSFPLKSPRNSGKSFIYSNQTIDTSYRVVDHTLPEIYADMPYFKTKAPFKDVAQFMVWFNDLTPYEQSVFITLLDRAHNYTLMYFSQNSLRSYHAHEKKISLRSVQDYMKKFRDEGVVYTVNRQTSQDKAQGVYETNLTYLHEIFRTDEFVVFIRSLCKRLKWYGFSFFKASLLASSITALHADFVLLNKGIYGTVNSLARNKDLKVSHWQESYGLQMLDVRDDERWSLAGMVSRVDERPHDTFPFFQKGEKGVCESVLTSISVPDTPSEWDFRVSGNEVNAQEPISRPSQGVLIVQESVVHNESYEAIKKELGRWPLTLKGMLKLSCYPMEVVNWLIGQEPPLDKKDPFTYALKMCSNRCRELGLPFPNYAKYDQAERELDLKSEPWMDVERVKELLAAKKKATHKPAQEFSYSAGYDKWGTKRPETMEEMEAVRLETIKKLEDMKAAGTLNVFAQILLENFTKNDPNSPANPLIPNGPTKAQVSQLLGST